MENEKSRVTIDFNFLSDCGYAESDKNHLLNQAIENKNAYYDKRNGIWYISNFDKVTPIQLYKNYIDYVNSNYKHWNTASSCISYLDMGLVPVLWGPSFIQDYIFNEVGVVAESWKKDLIFLPASSLLKRGYVGASKDVWIKKKELAEVLDVPLNKACLSTLLKRVSER